MIGDRPTLGQYQSFHPYARSSWLSYESWKRMDSKLSQHLQREVFSGQTCLLLDSTPSRVTLHKRYQYKQRLMLGMLV